MKEKLTMKRKFIKCIKAAAEGQYRGKLKIVGTGGIDKWNR